MNGILIHGFQGGLFLVADPVRLVAMTAIAQKLDQKLESWDAARAAQVEKLVSEIIELADSDGLDLLPSRQITQEVLDTLDEGQAGRDLAG